ncbi:phage tail tape measure protein [Reichenbachiella sp.]|uniref:phage tail tape measure protein n=1 Tax=Reichenbachiella sp. TaxID=2184521 RepID=UPI003B5CDD45
MRGIRIGVLYDLKDKLSGGLGRIKERMASVNKLQQQAKLKTKEYFGSFSKGIKNAMPSLDKFKAKNAQMFEAISDRVPFLGQLGGLLANPYALAVAAVVALSAAVFKLGEHMVDITKDIKDNQKVVQATFGITDQELRDTTATVMALSDTLKVETGEMIKAANALQREYADTGLTISDSLSLIKTGLQATGGQLDLEEIKEYASQMKAAGLNAQEFIALSATGKQQGLFNDKAVDAVKEFNLRLKEMTPAAKDALKNLKLSPDAILKGLDDGSLRTIDVLRKVSQAMANVNTQARQTAIADLFGGAGEDAGERFLLSLGKIDLSIKGISKGMEGLIAHQDKQIALNKEIRMQQSRFADVIQPAIKQWELFKLGVQEVFYGVLADAMDWLKGEWDKLRPIIMIIWKALKLGIVPTVIAITVAVKLLSGAFSLVASTIRGTYNVIKFFFQLIADGIQWVYQALGGEGNIWDKIFGKLDQWKYKVKVFFEDIAKFGSNAFSLFEALLERDPAKIKAAYDNIKAFSFRDSDAMYQASKVAQPDKVSEAFKAVQPPGQKPNTDELEDADNSTVASGTSHVRNVTVNIGSLVEGGINVTTQTIQESAQDIEEAFTSILVRAIRNVEQTI